MADFVRDIMTKNPVTLPATASLTTAARSMRDSAIGCVIVQNGDGSIQGILSDRDLVVRAIAEERDPSSTQVGECCSKELATLSPTDKAGNAVNLMRKKAIRRIPVVENGKAVGIVSLGDLAIDRDPESALGGISAARPNQ